MRLCLFVHSHPKQAHLAQGDLHIFPPINIVEGCKDSGYKSWGIHQYFWWLVNSSTSYVGTCKYHCKNQNQYAMMSIPSLPLQHYTFSSSVTPVETSMDKSRVRMEKIAVFTWKPSSFLCIMDIRHTCYSPKQGYDTMINFWTYWSIGKWEKFWSGLCTRISRTMYTEQD